jgi:hypothetical protein
MIAWPCPLVKGTATSDLFLVDGVSGPTLARARRLRQPAIAEQSRFMSTRPRNSIFPTDESAWRGGSPECQKTSQRISRGTCRPSRSQALVRHNLMIARVSALLNSRPAALSPHQFQDGLAQVDGGHTGEEVQAAHRRCLGQRTCSSSCRPVLPELEEELLANVLLRSRRRTHEPSRPSGQT